MQQLFFKIIMNCKNPPLAEQGRYVQGGGSGRTGWGDWPPQWLKEFSRSLCQLRARKGSCNPGKPELSEEQQKVEEDES